MTTAKTDFAFALIANACLFWPSATAPVTASGPHYCVAVSTHGYCAAPDTCACIDLKRNNMVVVTDAGYAMLPAAGSLQTRRIVLRSRGPSEPAP
jgi:hypothetical protein